MTNDERAMLVKKWLNPDHIRLCAGEMTAQEMRTVSAVLRAVFAEVAAAPQAPSAAHPDDAAVDRFAAAMKAKLAAARAKGRSGWNDPAQCTIEHLSDLLRGHVDKGDPVDVANFAMMLHQRGSGITEPATDAVVQALIEYNELLSIAGDIVAEGHLTVQDLARLRAHHEAATRAPAAEPTAPDGFALVPLRMTRAMQDVVDSEGWEWRDLLAAAEAITEEQHANDCEDEEAPEPRGWLYELWVEERRANVKFNEDGPDEEPFGAYGVEHDGEVVVTPLYATPEYAPKGEPVAWATSNDGGKTVNAFLLFDEGDAHEQARRCGGTTTAVPLYTPQPKRVPLTEDEIAQGAMAAHPWGGLLEMQKWFRFGVRFAEKHHGITGEVETPRDTRAWRDGVR